MASEKNVPAGCRRYKRKGRRDAGVTCRQDVGVTREGIVYLVGAGPGDPGLMTVRGRACLRRAEVVVYDHLANPRLVEEAPEGAERIYVGKEASRHTLRQEEIDALLVEKCLEGWRVVRLKGGDPFVFGRGGEEALALREANCRFEVVPGVTAGIAAAAYAGIPVTHRGVASAVTFVTGHEKPGKESSDIDWEQLARSAGTLVFYMGVGNLGTIVERLAAHGRAASTPVALVRWGTWPGQETITGALSDIVAKVKAAKFAPPAIIVVGEVAGLREKLNWFEARPLFGRRIVVTRSRAQAGELSLRLEELGAEAIEFPTIRIAPPEDPKPLGEAAARAGAYDWIVFTSVNGVDAFFEALLAAGKDARSLGGAKVCAIGPATSARLAERGVRADMTPAQYVAESVAESFRAWGVEEQGELEGTTDAGETPAVHAGETPALHDSETPALRGKRILLPRADIARSYLPEALEAMGARVDEVVAYRTVSETPPGADDLARELEAGRIDAVTFTSSSTARNFAELIGEEALRAIPEATRLVSIGPETTKTLRRFTKAKIDQADAYTIPGVVETLLAALARQGTQGKG